LRCVQKTDCTENSLDSCALRQKVTDVRYDNSRSAAPDVHAVPTATRSKVRPTMRNCVYMIYYYRAYQTY